MSPMVSPARACLWMVLGAGAGVGVQFTCAEFRSTSTKVRPDARRCASDRGGVSLAAPAAPAHSCGGVDCGELCCVWVSVYL